MLYAAKLAKHLRQNNFLVVRTFSATSRNEKDLHVAMILSGSGVYDGSEILETTSAMIHLSQNNAIISFFAPNVEQLHVVNHVTGDIQPETRNVMVESARISRGNIKPIEKLRATNFDALFIPGGFGAAKNLCDYAINGTKMSVNKDVERIIGDFIQANKPIGLCCVAPVLPAKLLPKCQLTLGKQQNQAGEWPYAGTMDACRELGAEVIERDVDEIQVDNNYKVVSTPAFMKTASYADIFEGIGRMVEAVLRLTK